MSRPPTATIRRALDALYFGQAHRLLGRTWSGAGVIFTLHRVHPRAEDEGFAPNRGLVLTPEFLELAIRQVLRAGRDVITLDDVYRRLTNAHDGRKFVCFTVDDGYRDFFYYAFPVFRRQGLPFTVFLNTAMPDGKALLWWNLLECVFHRSLEVKVFSHNKPVVYPARTRTEKETGFWHAYWWLRSMSEQDRISTVERLCRDHQVDPQEVCRSLSLTWAMVEEMANSGLARFEAHTVHHPMLSMIGPDAARKEASESREIIAARLGRVPRHFAYPYGDASSAGTREFEIARELGFDTAVTTRKGVVFKKHRDHLHALPRVSLNGEYQTARYVDLFLSGAPFALCRRFRRLDVD